VVCGSVEPAKRDGCWYCNGRGHGNRGGHRPRCGRTGGPNPEGLARKHPGALHCEQAAAGTAVTIMMLMLPAA